MPSERYKKIRKEWNCLEHVGSWSMSMTLINGENINAINENTEALLQATREVCLELNRGNYVYGYVLPPICRKIIIY
jgi:hypothetical protein